MVISMKVSKVWEILGSFKSLCRRRGWKTSETEDWVETDDLYHKFLWTREIHPSSFRKMVSDKKCVVREGLSYHVVHAAYTAWLFSETPPSDMVKTVSESPELSRRIALYDLSQVAEGRTLCVKLNNTDSHVFQEFENFLERELKVKVEPLPPILLRRSGTGNCEAIVVA
jgi:hypothetical protein